MTYDWQFGKETIKNQLTNYATEIRYYEFRQVGFPDL